jgi:S-adenosylmethionine:tRNA ribosyltransferase-isomerase
VVHVDRLASVPVAFEPPSAGFVLDWATVQRLRDRGAALATLTHAAGISSTGDAA